MVIPCWMNALYGMSGELQIGMMLAGKCGEDATKLRAADTWRWNFGG